MRQETILILCLISMILMIGYILGWYARGYFDKYIKERDVGLGIK